MLPFMTPMMQSAGVALPATTWNPADKAAQITLSADNLTASQNTSSTPGIGVRGTNSRSNGKIYAEIVNLGPDAEMGLLSGSAALADMYSDDNSAWVYASSSLNVFRGGSRLYQGNAAPTNTVFGYAWDITANKLSIYMNGASLIDLTGYAPGRPMFLAFVGFTAGSGARLRTTAAQFTQSIPAGFTPWG